MPSSIAIKIASGLGLVGISGGGFAVYKSGIFKTKTTLRDLIKKDKWELLTEKDTTHISSILEAYKKEGEPKPTLLFSGFTGKESNASKKLLEKCKGVSVVHHDDSNKDFLLKQIKKWCVIPKTIRTRLKDLNISPLSTTEPTTPSTESKKWTDKVISYESGSNKFDQLANLNGGDNNAKAKVLRTHCESQLSVQSFVESFESVMDKVKSWCT